MDCVQIGACTLYRGDFRDVVPTLGHVDAVITDPPYGVELTGKVTKHTRNTPGTVYADTPAHVASLLVPLMDWTLQASTRAVITPGTRMLWTYPTPTSMGCIFTPNGAGCDRWGFSCFHPILYYGQCPYLASGQGGRPNSFSSSRPGMHVTKEQSEHPCPKPLAWMLWLVTRGSLPGEMVVDPLMGSGTTGVACVQLGRSFIGVEIDERYFHIACHRIAEAYAQLPLFPPADHHPPPQTTFW